MRKPCMGSAHKVRTYGMLTVGVLFSPLVIVGAAALLSIYCLLAKRAILDVDLVAACQNALFAPDFWKKRSTLPIVVREFWTSTNEKLIAIGNLEEPLEKYGRSMQAGPALSDQKDFGKMRPVAPLYVFLHIPTTGGRSLTSMSVSFKSRKIPLSLALRATTFTNNSRSRFKLMTSVCGTLDEIVYGALWSGHLGWGALEQFFGFPSGCQRPLRVITILREPFARVTAWLNHQADNATWFAFKQASKTGCKLLSPHCSTNLHTTLYANLVNCQVYQIGASLSYARNVRSSVALANAKKVLMQYGFFVGFTEQIQASLVRLGNMMGLEVLSIPHVRTTAMPWHLQRNLSETDRKYLEAMIAADIDLYRWARQRYWEAGK